MLHRCDGHSSRAGPLLPSLAILYIDPVAGSIAIQAVVAGMVGGIAFFRRSIGRFFRLILGRRQPHPPEQ